jgi:3-oxoacyl-[acyl-carrier protein] reductase
MPRARTAPIAWLPYIRAKGGKAIAVQGDVAKAADVKKIFVEAKQAYGRLDILVNNAGVYNLLPLEEVTEQEFHRHFNINVLVPRIISARNAVFPCLADSRSTDSGY